VPASVSLIASTTADSYEIAKKVAAATTPSDCGPGVLTGSGSLPSRKKCAGGETPGRVRG